MTNRAALALPTVGLLGITFLARANQAVIQTTMPLLGQQRLHFSPSTIGYVVGGYGLAAAVTARGLSARLSGKQLAIGAIFGLVIMAGASSFFAMSTNSLMFCVAILTGGIGGGLCFPCLITIAGHSGSKGAEHSIARYTVAISASVCMGPLIEFAILNATHQSLNAAFWSFAPLPIVGAIVCLAIVPRSAVSSIKPGVVTADLHEEPIRFDFATLNADQIAKTDPAITKQAFRLAILVLIICEIPFGSVIYFGGLMARHEDHASLAQVALLFAGYFAISFFARLVFAAKAPINNKVRLARACFVIMIVGTSIAMLTHGIVLLALAMMVLGGGDGLTYTLGLSLVAAYTPADKLARANSIFSMVENGSGVIIPPIVGLLAGVIGYRGAIGSMMTTVVIFGIMAWTSRIEDSPMVGK